MRPEYDFSKGERGKFFHPNAKLILPATVGAQGWAGPKGDLGAYITEESRRTLNAYASQPHLVLEHANREQDTARGGYAHRQLFELVQNGADALSGASEGGHIAIRLTDSCLYCADDGEPISRAGVTALMFSHMSPKRGTSEIGRFGLGFKSVLGVTDSPEFFSRDGSFRFDRRTARERIRAVAPGAERCPVLRIANPVDPHEARDKDPVLGDLMEWATNIVRLPLDLEKVSDLRKQMQDFPSEFLLFVHHVRRLRIDDGAKLDRVLELEDAGDEYRLIDGSKAGNWKLFKVNHPLSSDARADRRSLDDADEVPIWWAAPLDRLTDPGDFWAYFPTVTRSLVAGILNAPWKTNEDRQNLLPGPYNDELIAAAAEMIADKLAELATCEKPARHLDALPRRHESGDSNQSERLRNSLLAELCGRDILPDQDGTLRRVPNINYPPKELTSNRPHGEKVLEKWAQFSGRPSNWLHREATLRNRLARVEQLVEHWKSANGYSCHYPRRASVADWLEALVTERTGSAAVEASRTALVTAAAIPADLRRSSHTLGSILLMANGAWKPVEPDHVFLPRNVTDAGSRSSAAELVHPTLARDADARQALLKLGVNLVSADGHLKHVASRLLGHDSTLASDDEWCRFWTLTRDVDAVRAEQTITNQRRWREHLRVRTQADDWAPIHRALRPGRIVQGTDDRDWRVAIDLDFHAAEEGLLDRLGVVAEPDGARELSMESWFGTFRDDSRRRFKARGLVRQPHDDRLNFESTKSAGPLDVLKDLSNTGRADYTAALLHLDSLYESWIMRHDTQSAYPELKVESPAVRMLTEYGRLRTETGVVLFADALGAQPRSKAARDVLLAHPKADSIKAAFDLVEPAPEFFGDEDPIPLSDVWPGFQTTLRRVQKVDCPNINEGTHLVRCGRILVGGDEHQCILHASNIWVCRSEDEKAELMSVLRLVHGLCSTTGSRVPGSLASMMEGENEETLDLVLHGVAEAILQFTPPLPVGEQRDAIRALPTEAERLLKAVGEPALRRQLPHSLLSILEQDGTRSSGVEVAEAAIATYHTGALRRYRRDIEHLDPPRQWAGSARALDFVLALGFSAEWAGERNERRSPFVEVDGPYALPELHDYQKVIVAKVRDMLRRVRGAAWGTAARSNTDAVRSSADAEGRDRRGMISLPTGSGKTRVAVQAIVEAMCHDRFDGTVLWVADRDELCEQAVEAWTQVWSNVGASGLRLRVSRMWAGQPAPLPTTDLHVVVATIQTLHARFRNPRAEHDFLADCTLVVFDEAHRSIAPTFTSVMEEIGLTRWQRKDEPFLLGLTATPYRGHDAEETARLVKRYGRNRLDAGAFAHDDPEQVVSELQRMHVLALADHQTIEGGRFSLSADECRQMNTKPRPPWLPRSVEDRIAQDAGRTNRIIEAYEEQVRNVDPDWPVLIFATSVEHAQTIAALLSRIGVPSRAVSGETETVTRRRIVEEFRRGDLKVLVNYGVFREGFDAPRTRVIIVARPVYSPNLYFQMIGRGLRGTRNGGTDRCLMINVQDNIDNFEGKLACSDLDWLWV